VQRRAALGLAAALLFSSACAPAAEQIRDHRKAFESLGATTAVVVQAWLEGDVSGTYTRTALETTLQLIEQERAALAGSPRLLARPDAAALAESADRLSRLVAFLARDIASGDSTAARAHLGEIPILPAEVR
jgi:hypothetical protein